MRFYVGQKDGARTVFKSATPPTTEAYPQFAAVIGPFDTKRGATWAASPAARGNPHFNHVRDAERIAKEAA